MCNELGTGMHWAGQHVAVCPGSVAAAAARIFLILQTNITFCTMVRGDDQVGPDGRVRVTRRFEGRVVGGSD